MLRRIGHIDAAGDDGDRPGSEGSPVRRYEQAGDKLGYLLLRGDSAADLRRAERLVEDLLDLRIGAPYDALLDDAAVG